MAYSNGYSPAQIMAMQKDAVRRVNEMQRLAQEKLRQTESAIGGGPAQPAEAESRPANAQPPPPENTSHFPGQRSGPHPNEKPQGNGHPPRGHMNQPPGRETDGKPPAEPPRPDPPEIPVAEAELVASPFQGILQRLNLDQESIMLIVMLLLLINEGADVMLIMALVYILL